MGAKITSQLYENKQITLDEAEHILVFSNNPGPLFLIGTIGAGFFRVPFFGYLLLLSAFFGAVATGIFWRFRRKKVSPFHRSFLSGNKELSLTEVLSGSVSDAMNTILLIGGYLILFAALSEAMEQIRFFSFLSDILFFLPISTDSVQGLFSGILEMTNGAYLLSQSPDELRLRLTLVAFLVSFGGLSILGQTFGVLSSVPINKTRLPVFPAAEPEKHQAQCPGRGPHSVRAEWSQKDHQRFQARRHRRHRRLCQLPGPVRGQQNGHPHLRP